MSNAVHNIGDLVHITRGFYRGRAGRIISSSLNSVSIKTAQGVTTVNRGDIASGSSPVPLPPQTSNPQYKFNPGDMVVITREGHSNFGERAKYIRPSMSFTDIAILEFVDSGERSAQYFSHFELAPDTKRVEGKEIDYKDVEVGDTITSKKSFTDQGVEVVIVRTGVVSSKNWNTLYTKDSGTINNSLRSTLILVKKAPEVNKTLKTLEDYPLATVITFSTTQTYTAVKTNSGWILTASNGSTQSVTSERLSTIIGTRSFRKIN
jgi:hypothetical protein